MLMLSASVASHQQNIVDICYRCGLQELSSSQRLQCQVSETGHSLPSQGSSQGLIHVTLESTSGPQESSP